MDLSLATLLPIAWYLILGVAVFAYALGDGFDLGIGSIYLSVGKKERQIMLQSIGPVWDGNEVWLIIIFGGLFAGFPSVYGTLLSIFYMPIWSLIFLYIFRGCSLEFRNKVSKDWWVLLWDVIFSLTSMLISFSLGTLAGNILLGVPLSSDHYEYASWSLFFRPFAVLCGLLTLGAFSMHGITFTLLKTPVELQKRLVKLFQYIFSGYLMLYLMIFSVIIIGIKQAPDLYILTHFFNLPKYCWLSLSMILSLLGCFLCQKNINRGRHIAAFLCSAMNMLCVISSFSIVMFPNLLIATDSSQSNMTIFNAAANVNTLKSLVLIVLFGLPFVVLYNVYIYRLFKGKIDLK